ncbi:Molecular chaperone DnaK (HSP70) [Streptomyces sp. MnatMP-M77]|uniref:Hsp70 family protein n=1 Tax=unclassified Streptomyces TaxID=2593676 RepID=UPI000804AA3D|nr:Hsp70 family protein [Streptomyces sp. MnatMP-M77]MYT82483.1 Hsp70 family protein [Streptomyces sp. SID8364]SBV02457.1 Molecular chaperone DnaK (HSP70) [Streptomyces sp. MnatMP-M77]
MEPLRAGDPESVGGFVLLGRLGAGGMGEVFLGRSPGGRAVAVKVMHPHLARQEEFRQRFAREVAAARAVSGAFTAPVMAAGPEDDRPWIATVYVPGPDLATAVGVAGPLPEGAVWRLAAGLVEVLQAIHVVGVVHRDLKPSNVLVAADGPRVIDFGIARTLEDTPLTMTGLVVGTAGFMAPEQAEGGEVGSACDVFALGAVIAFAATGAGPFGEGPQLAVLRRVVGGRPRLDGLTGPLRELVEACLAKDPRDRPVLATLLERIGAHWEPADEFRGGSPWPEAVTTLIQRHATPPTAPYTEAAGATAPPDGGPDAARRARRAVGIDFGTTNSAVAVMEGGEVSLIPNAQGRHTTPSLVALTAEGDALVGTDAERQALANPGFTAGAAMLWLGTDWRVARGGVRLTAEDVAGLVLARLREDAEAYLGEPVTDAVLAVPAGFRRDQRAALVRAGERAGLNVLRLVNVPSAVAMSYGPNRDDLTVLVFDLGGGTLDVSLIELGEGVVEIRATAGDSRLGGNDWDQRIVEHLTDHVRRRHGVDLTGNVAAIQRLREAAETARIELSAARTTTVRLPYLATGPDSPVHLEEELTREELERLTQDLLERCRTPVENVLADAGCTLADIDQVVLTGGAALMPAVGDLVRRLTGGQGSYQRLSPEAVVHGAVLQAGALTGEVKDVLLLDVAPYSIGVETHDGTMTKLLLRNTAIPTRRSDVFTTHTDDQPMVLFHIVEGERKDAARNWPLAVLELALPPVPRGVPMIEVTVDCTAKDDLHIKVRDLGTGNETSATVGQATRERAAALLRSSRWARLRDLVPVTHPAC